MPKLNPGVLGYRFFQIKSLDFGSVAAGDVEDETVTVKGLRKNAPLIVHIPGLTAGLVFCNAYASAANTLSVRFYNDTGSAIDMAATDCYITQF